MSKINLCLGFKSMWNTAVGIKNSKQLFLYTCMQNPRSRTVYRQRK